jgi:glutaredoxin
MLTIYTKDKCFYCKNLKRNLEKWGFAYEEINIQFNDAAIKLFKDMGYTTVPQLYYGAVNIQLGDSSSLTRDIIYERIKRIAWPSVDSGIE